MNEYSPNDNYIISEAGFLPKITSDHCVICASLEHKIPKLKMSKHMVWDYKRVNYAASRQLLPNAPWYSCYNSYDIVTLVNN